MERSEEATPPPDNRARTGPLAPSNAGQCVEHCHQCDGAGQRRACCSSGGCRGRSSSQRRMASMFARFTRRGLIPPFPAYVLDPPSTHRLPMSCAPRPASNICGMYLVLFGVSACRTQAFGTRRGSPATAPSESHAQKRPPRWPPLLNLSSSCTAPRMRAVMLLEAEPTLDWAVAMRWRGIFRCRSAVGGVRRSSQPLCPIARDARAFPPSPSKAQLVSDEAHVWSCVLPDEGKGGGCLGPGACRNPQVAQAWARSSSRGSPLACPRRPAPRSRCPRRRNSAASARSSVISFPREDRRVGRHEGPREVARLAGVVGMFSSPISATTVVRTWALAELLGTILGSPRCGVGSSIAKLSRSRYEPNRHTIRQCHRV